MQTTSPDDPKHIPRPETTRAYLITAGSHRPVFTLHHYVETRPTRLRGGGKAWEHIFKCFKTNAVRRWGIEERKHETVDEIVAREGN